MALTFVGTATEPNATATVSFTIPAGVAIPVGALVLVSAGKVNNNLDIASCADDAGNTYTRDIHRRQGNAAAGIFSAPVTAQLNPGNVVTVTIAGAVANKAMALYWVDNPGAPALDQTGSNASASALGTDVTVSTAGAIAQADEYALGAAVHLGGTSGWTQPAGWAEDLDTTLGSRQISLASMQTAAAGIVTYDPDNDSAAAIYAAVLATYKFVPASPPPPPPPPPPPADQTATDAGGGGPEKRAPIRVFLPGGRIALAHDERQFRRIIAEALAPLPQRPQRKKARKKIAPPPVVALPDEPIVDLADFERGRAEIETLMGMFEAAVARAELQAQQAAATLADDEEAVAMLLMLAA